MHDYDILVTRSCESIHGVVDESNDRRNHHYYTVFDMYPSSKEATKMKLKTHINRLEISGLKGLVFNEKLAVTVRDRSGCVIGTSIIPMGRAFKIHGQMTYEKDLDLPCAFDKIHRIGVHFI